MQGEQEGEVMGNGGEGEGATEDTEDTEGEKNVLGRGLVYVYSM